MFWISDIVKMRSIINFFWNFFVLNLDTIKLHQIVGNYIRNIIVPEKFFKIFDRFWDICHVLIFWHRKKLKQNYFLFFFVLNLAPIKLRQIVGNYIRNIIAPERFFKIFDRFWDFCHVLIFWHRKNLGSKIRFFFSENFNFLPSHNKFIQNCGELHKECYCFKEIFQNNW